MEVCGPAVVPIGWFLGGPNRWDPFSRDAQLAWLADSRSRCRDCGEYDDEWRNEKGEGLIGRKAPKVVVEQVCPGCAAIELHRNSKEEQEPTPGAKVTLVPRHRAGPASPGGARRRPR
jgi:hypothetical protein